MEPLNPSFTVTWHYTLDRKTFKEISGKLDTFSILDISMIKSLCRFLKRKMVKGRFTFIRKLIILR